MIETYFYNSNNGDRLYSATSMEYWLKRFFTSGVFAGDCQVSLSGAMTLSVAAGFANLDGKVMRSDEAVEVTVSQADASLQRIDLVVIERNDTTREVTIHMVDGTPGGAAPAPVRANGIYQLVLAQVTVPANAVVIQAANIRDTRADSALCGIVAQAVQSYTFDQFAAQFEAWFDDMRSQMAGDEDALAALLAQLTDLTPVDIPLTLSGSGWTADSETGGYSQLIPAASITYEYQGTTIPYPLTDATEAYCDLDMSGATAETAADLEDDWALIGRIAVDATGVTAYCFGDLPSTSVPFTLRVVKKG